MSDIREKIMAEILPSTCIPVPKIEEDGYDWYKRHDTICRRCQEEIFDIVFIGDSITHYFQKEEENGSDHGSEVWEEFYGKRKVLNMGYGFDRTQNVLWRLEHGELANQNPKFIVVHIGTNQYSGRKDPPEDTAKGILLIVEKLRELCPDSQILLMAVFPRYEKNHEVRLLIGRANAIVEESLRKKGDAKVTFLDLSGDFTTADGEQKKEAFRPCCTHLTPAGYRIWAGALEKFFAGKV